jgi:4-hydroxybenzoate polyprenyltransferase
MAAYREGVTTTRYIIELSIAFIVAVIMRSFACTVNDICDYEFDKGVGKVHVLISPSQS